MDNTSASYNTATGDAALASNNTGNNNTANGASALYFNTSGNNNTGNGYNALGNNSTGSNNTAEGYYALSSNITGSDNTALGYQALLSNTSNDITAIGSQALKSNTSGSINSAIGYRALSSNTSGFNNTAIGYQSSFLGNSSYNTSLGAFSLQNNEGGNSNTAIGEKAMAYSLGNSFSNTAVGSGAMQSSIAERGFSNNVAVGFQSLFGVGNNANNNTAVGYWALKTLDFGSGNTAVGYYADVFSGSLTNASAFGYIAKVQQSNQIILGNAEVTSIGGHVEWTNLSDGRYKQNIKQDVPGLKFINKLQPVTYTFNIKAIETKTHPEFNTLQTTDGKSLSNPLDDSIMKQAMDEKSKIVYTGFIAQDVEKAAKSVNYNFSGIDKPNNVNTGFYGLSYGDFVVLLVKAVQELSKMNDDKNTKIDSLQKQVNIQQPQNADLQKQFNDLKNIVQSIRQKQDACSPCANAVVNTGNAVFTDGSSLEQNIPNPFTHNASIGYTLPQKFSKAQIIITDKNGKTLLVKDVSGAGKGRLNVYASVLASGEYNYLLLIDGKLIAGKNMILTR